MPLVPLPWLAESVELLPGSTPEDVAAALVRVGLEEEGVHTSGVVGPLVVGRVLSLVKEEQANGKTINYCRVDVGQHNDPAGPGHAPDDKAEYPASRGIVCGAHNFVEGDWVVVVLPGATLPGPFPIAGRKTYGHWSDGMICSAKELGLGEDAAGIIVLASPSGASESWGFDADALTPGEDALALLGLDEVTLEVNVTPDRGYCFSMRGVAREYSHSTGASFTDPAGIAVTGEAGAGAASSGFAVELDDAAPIRGRAGCDRFVARVLRGFDPAAPTPEGMRRRLRQAGMRPISLAVDVTNYVMLELGQPLHAYDLGALTAPIVVRRAAVVKGAGESLTTLDGAERALHAEDLVIADSQGGRGKRAVGLAGVMGGLDTEISAATTDILLEAAHFDPVTVARTARRHKLGSEASRRFERGVDPALPPVAVERALRLMQQFGGGEIEDVYTDVDATVPPAPIEMPADFPDRIVGVEYGAAVVRETLERVGCQVTGDTTLTVVPPTWRPDITAPIDLVEEVARLHGYDDLPSVLPAAPPGRGLTHAQRVRRSVSRTLAERGLTEVLTYPFVDAARLDALGIPADDRRRNAVKLANALNAEVPFLRTMLLETLVDAAAVNLGRGVADLAIFEVGAVNRAEGVGLPPAPDVSSRPSEAELKAIDAALPFEETRVAGLLAGARVPAGWNDAAQPVDWSDAVAAALAVADAAGVKVSVANDAHEPWHPGRCAVLTVDGGGESGGEVVGHAGELHPKVLEVLGLPRRTVAFELSLTALARAGEGAVVQAAPMLTQPLAKEDFAFVVDAGLPAADLVATVHAAAGELLEDARVFDVYDGEQVGAGKKSVAVTVRLRATDRTLSADEILAVRNAIIAAAKEQHSAALR